jgi:hypothetical protein
VKNAKVGFMVAPMNSNSALLSIFMGVATVMFAVLSNKFYWLKGYTGGDKEAPPTQCEGAFRICCYGLNLVGFRYLIVG